MIELHASNENTHELVLKFNQHSYNYIYSVLKNALYPRYRNLDIPESWTLKLTNCMKLFAIIYYRNVSEKKSVCGDYPVVAKFFKVKEDTIVSWLKSLEKAGFIFVEYKNGFNSFRADWNDKNVWLLKAKEFQDNGRYNFFKYSKYPVCSIVIPGEMENIDLAFKYIDQAKDVIDNDRDWGVLRSIREKNLTLNEIVGALQCPYGPVDKPAHNNWEVQNLYYVMNLLSSLKKVLKSYVESKETT